MNQAIQNSKRRIAVFGIKTHPAFAGADRVVENIINNMEGEFDFFIYLVKRKEEILYSNSENKHFIYVPSLKGKHLHAFSYFFLCTMHLIFIGTYDLVHAHNSDVGLFTYFLCLKYKGRIMGTFHGNPYESAKWGRIAKWYLRFSEKLFIKSCKILTSVSATKTIVGKKIAFIPNGMEEIDVNKFKDYTNQSINYEKLKIQRGNYLLFVAGRLDQRKGLHYLLNAYHNDKIDRQLFIVSDFTHDIAYSESIDLQIQRLGKKNPVVLKRLLPKEDLFDIILNAKLVVFPSEVEAMSMFLLEVLACNTTVVCSDIQSNIQIVGEDYKYLFKNADVDSLSEVIQSTLKEIDADKSKDSFNKRQEIKLKHDWKKIVRDYSVFYKSFFDELTEIQS
jgi:glycosyltransferase involved in cell wall biosynthesis